MAKRMVYLEITLIKFFFQLRFHSSFLPLKPYLIKNKKWKRIKEIKRDGNEEWEKKGEGEKKEVKKK